MACCAMPGGCGDPQCYLCTVTAKLPQPVAYRERAVKLDTRDGAPTLSAERKKKDLAFRPRRREGAVRQQRL